MRAPGGVSMQVRFVHSLALRHEQQRDDGYTHEGTEHVNLFGFPVATTVVSRRTINSNLLSGVLAFVSFVLCSVREQSLVAAQHPHTRLTAPAVVECFLPVAACGPHAANGVQALVRHANEACSLRLGVLASFPSRIVAA